MVFKSRVQSIGNCLICLDPKSCNIIFFSKKLDTVIYRQPYFKRKLTDLGEFSSLSLLLSQVCSFARYRCSVYYCRSVPFYDTIAQSVVVDLLFYTCMRSVCCRRSVLEHSTNALSVVAGLFRFCSFYDRIMIRLKIRIKKVKLLCPS